MGEDFAMADRRSSLPAALKLGAVSYMPVPPMARFVFRGDETACAIAGHALAIVFPDTLRAAEAHGVSVLWQGPDEFLILSADGDGARISAALANALLTIPHSLVDVSHRNAGFVLDGADVEALLNAAVMLDLDERAFPVGMTTRTLFSKADITLWRQSATRFHLEMWRSFAPYVTGVLAEAARGL